MYTAQQVANSIDTNTALPYVDATASAAQAFALSVAERGCGSDEYTRRDEASLYSGRRLFNSIKLAQGAGDSGQVLHNGVATFVNPALLEGAVQGRSQKLTVPDAYKDDSNLGFVPFRQIGGSVGGIRPELYVGSISEGLSAPEKTELLNQRSFLRSELPTFNMFPESEAEAARKQNVCRLNTIQKNYVRARLNAASNGSW